MRVVQAKQAFDAGDHQLCGQLLADELLVNPECPEALFLYGRSLIEHDKPSLALPVFEKLVAVAPDRPEHWSSLAHVEMTLQRGERAEAALRKALELKPNDPPLLRAMGNAAVIRYDLESAIWYANKSLERDDHPSAHASLAFAYLHQRKWGLGWDHYHRCRNWMKWRDQLDYGIPEWEGQKDGTLLLYGEQGLGDQIAYLSTAAKLGGRVVQIDVHSKLKPLMARSLNCEAHNFNAKQPINWEVRADYAINLSGLQKFLARAPEAFHRKPYLVPHPVKKAQWKAALDLLGDRPKVGIAWTGGLPTSQGYRTRKLELADLQPLLDMPYDWISLEYNRHPDIPGVIQWPWATQTNDYDDTVALIANLDAVVCVPTTAYHAAGGLGVPAHVIVHDTPHFHEGLSGPCPWWESVTFYRRPELGTEGAIQQVKEALRASVEAR